MNAHTQPSADTKPAILLFGTDEGGKAHASSFLPADAELARKAAALMGMSVMAITTEAEQAIAAKVPKGRIFASGKAFTPFIAAKLFSEIKAIHWQSGQVGDAALGSSPAHAPSAVPVTGGAVPPAQPNNWGEIVIGMIVLAAAAPRHTDWFEVQVVGDDGHDTLTLRYCDWPQEQPFERRRDELALIHPSRQPEPPVEAEQPAEAA